MKLANRNINPWLLSFFFIITITFFSLLPCLNNQFTNWDDPEFVYENPTIQNLSFANLKNILTQVVVKNWHPLTMLSYAIEHHFFGLNPQAYHVTNLILHLLNTALVFYLLKLLTQNWKLTAFVTFLFGIHPMHVESIAWISERKDVLFGFFYLLSMIVYIFYLKSGLKKRFWMGALLLFICSLLSKATAASLPIVLLLLDYYFKRQRSIRVFLEKIPFLIFSIIGGLIIVGIHEDVLTLRSKYMEAFTIVERICLASFGTLGYFQKLFFPFQLSAIYPYPEKIDGSFSLLFYASPFIILTLLASLIVIKHRYRREFILGGLFFFITIFINLPFSVIGQAIIADRYIYIPCLGVFIIMGLAIDLLIKQKWNTVLKSALMIGLCGYFLSWSVVSFKRCLVWRDSEQLWNDVIRQYPKTGFAYYNRGLGFMAQKKYDQAILDFTKTLEHGPVYIHIQAYLSRGQSYGAMAQYPLAIKNFSRAISINPYSMQGLYNRGVAYLLSNQPDPAIDDLTKAISINPHNLEMYKNRGLAYTVKGQYDLALEDFNKILSVNPNSPEPYYNMSKTYFKKGDHVVALQLALKAHKMGYPVNPQYLSHLIDINKQ